MFPPEAFQSLLMQLASLLDSHGIRFAITGGLVSGFYTEPRFTQDIDVLIDRDALAATLPSMTEAYATAGYQFDREEMRRAVQAGRPFQLFHVAECLRLDMYPRELVPGELLRASRVELYPGVMLPIVSQPDLVISKLVWISRGSHKSRRDVKQLVRLMATDGIEQVREAAAERKLESLLDEVLAEPDEFED